MLRLAVVEFFRRPTVAVTYMSTRNIPGAKYAHVGEKKQERNCENSGNCENATVTARKKHSYRGAVYPPAAHSTNTYEEPSVRI